MKLNDVLQALMDAGVDIEAIQTKDGVTIVKGSLEMEEEEKTDD